MTSKTHTDNLSIIPEDIILNDNEIESLANELEEEIDDYLYDDSLDGDFETAMTSAGWGNDESYNYWVEDF